MNRQKQVNKVPKSVKVPMTQQPDGLQSLFERQLPSRTLSSSIASLVGSVNVETHMNVDTVATR